MADLTPEDLLQIHKDYADEFAALAQSGLVGAFGALSSSGIFRFVPSQISITSPNFGTPNKNIKLPNTPRSPNEPKIGDLEKYVEVVNQGASIGGGGSSIDTPPTNTLGQPPQYIDPIKPQQIPGFTVAAPTIDTTVNLPPLPAFLSLPALALPYPTVDVPAAPSLTLPVFEGVRPDALTLPDPQSMIDKYKQEQVDHRNLLPGFVQTQADALLAKYCPEYAQLRARINQVVIDYTDPVNGGGAGIPANIEGAIAARNSDRNNLEFQRALETASDTLAKKGFTIPPGAMLATLRQARMAMGDAQVRGNVEIATKNFELEQQNMQFMLKLGEALEEKVLETITQYLNLALRIDELSITSAKEITATYLGVYNLQVQVYRALWEGYQADAQVYKVKVDALEANVRLYEAEIKAELAKTEINKATVEILQVVATVNQTLANAYKAEVEAATATLEVARVRLALFESQVRAFAAQVGVYEAQWRGYEAEVNGQVGKMRGFEAQATAYVAQVNAYRAQVEAYAEKIRAIAAENQAIASKNDATLRVYATEADIAIKTYEGLTQQYVAESNAAIKQADIEVEYWRTTASLVMQEWNVAVQQMFEYAREQMNLFRGQMEAAISAGNGLAHAAQVAGSLAGSAMAGLTSFAGNLVSSEQ